MQTLISMLRGINVSGTKKVPMKELKALYESMGLKDVLTYIQSGNVIFKTEENADIRKLSIKIEQAIKNHFGFDVPVFIRTANEIEQTIANNPVGNEKDADLEKLYVTFLADHPKADQLKVIKEVNYPSERFWIEGTQIYLYCTNGYGNAKLNNNFLENKLKVSATTRNWKTVNKLLALAGGH